MKSKRVLLADENPQIRLQLSKLLIDAGHQVRSTASAATVLNWLRRDPADLVILEAGGEGSEVVREIRKAEPDLPIVLTSARPTLVTAVNAVGIGAVELLPKPVHPAELLNAVEKAFACPRDREAAAAQARAAQDERLPMIGSAEPMQQVYRTLARLAEPSIPVLIWGESGVGKTTAAKALHDLGPRRDAPFVRLTAGGMSAEALTRDLLGDERAAGKMAQAQDGTLLLACVDDLSWEAQSQLLHVLELTSAQRARPRLIFAARQDLRQAMNEGRFRDDLYFRLSTTAVRLPALREHPEDIPDLARALLARASRAGLASKQIDAAAVRRLQLHRWPGNVRELDNLMRRLCVLHTEELITAPAVDRELETADFTPRLRAATTASDQIEQPLAAYFDGQAHGHEPVASGLYEAVMATVEKPLLQAALAAARGNQAQAAEILGISIRTLRRKVTSHRCAPAAGAGIAANDVAGEELRAVNTI